MKQTDTIAGIATPLGAGGVGIVRVSGPEARKVLDRVFCGRVPAEGFEPRNMVLGTVKADGFSDRCLAVLFPAPHSYTGEDVAELHVHGGRALTAGVLDAALRAGARLAENGEFTKRAFLNGKITLSGAEGVIDMINAESAAELNAAYGMLRGGLHREAEALQGELTDLLSRLEVTLDYPEEEVDEADTAAVLGGVRERLARLAESYRTGRMLREGVTVAVCGKPNVGKSSLMNRLLDYDRAIVTDEAGTTRDTLEAVFLLRGVKIALVDTAGIRDGASTAERLGVERAREAARGCDVALFVTDGTAPPDREDREIAELLAGKQVLLLCNKKDAPGYDAARYEELGFSDILQVSACTGEGMDTLKDRLFCLVTAGNVTEGGVVLTNERHIDVVRRAAAAADAALCACRTGCGDVIAMEVKNVWDILGEITGTTATEAIIDNIFSKFCLGK